MKHSYLAKLRFLLFVLFGLTCSLKAAWAQSGTGSISGRVADSKDEGLPGVTVLIDGTSIGASTNVDGTYSISGIPAGPHTVVISFVGYTTVRQPVTVAAGQNTTIAPQQLGENATALTEAVVIGYGTQRRQDLTGAVEQIDSKQFVQGQVTNPEQLVQGKVAGVQITTGGGAPGTGTQILIRGGSSLNASNQPLIVIDGVPVDNTNIAGSGNPLTQINPNDIASITVLKDASSTAIYGVRASNGVIIVTTKRGLIGEPTHVNVSTQLSVATIAKYNDVLSPDQFRALVRSAGSAGQIQSLGTANTDWQKEIFRNAFTADNNVSVSGAAGKLPYRASIGYLNQEGILLNNNLKRYTGSVNLNPVLLDGDLHINLNVRGSLIDNNFGPADQGSAIGNALSFDPTQSVYSSDPRLAPFGGYFQYLAPSSNTTLNPLAPLNPVAQIEQIRNRSTVKRSIGNIQFDYKLPFFKGLSANVNLGYDVQRGNGSITQPINSAEVARGQNAGKGANNTYQQGLNNRLLEAYGKYERTLGPGRLELLAGYSYQRFENIFYSQPNYALNGTTIVTPETPANQVTGASSARAVNVLLSYYSRLNYSIAEKYLFTGTIRRDETSRFAPGYRVGYFPSGAFAWRIKGENFLKDSKAVSELKLRFGYGQTGQQDVGDFYPYVPSFSLSGQGSQYQIGYNADGSPRYVNTLRPNAFNPGITWETTTTYNAGLDYGFADGRFYGSVDVYQRDTKNLLNFTNIQVGGGISNAGTYNVGSLTNKGIEAVLNFDLVKSDRLNVTVNANATYNRNRLTKLTLTDSPSDLGSPTGGISGGVGNNIQINTVGYPTQSFYVYQQVYDANGRPLEGVYVDRNGDGTFSSGDFYRYKSPRPDYILGGGANINYRGLNLAFSLRANLGNYVYNNRRSQAFYDQSTTGFLINRTSNILTTGFTTAQYFSDYFVENASFLRMDNATLGYNFGALMKKGTNLNLTLAVQNVFIVTKYSGIDPEVIGGIDNTIYPRPRTFTVGLNFGI